MNHDLETSASQLTAALGLLERYFSESLIGVYLFGSALDGGLRPESDLDLLVCVNAPIGAEKRAALMSDLLTVSAWPGADSLLRPLEVTVVQEGAVCPWQYPPERELQFGEWLREDILAGNFFGMGATQDKDLAILFSKLLLSNQPLYGPEAELLFDPVPRGDLVDALMATLALWDGPSDWHGDERNVILTLARVWLTLSTGAIAPKDEAADQLLERIPLELAPILRDARDGYRGIRRDDFRTRADEISRLLRFVKEDAERL